MIYLWISYNDSKYVILCFDPRVKEELYNPNIGAPKFNDSKWSLQYYLKTNVTKSES